MEDETYFDISLEESSSFVEESVDPSPATSNFSLSGSGLTNILLIGVLFFCILIFARSRNG